MKNLWSLLWHWEAIPDRIRASVIQADIQSSVTNLIILRRLSDLILNQILKVMYSEPSLPIRVHHCGRCHQWLGHLTNQCYGKCQRHYTHICRHVDSSGPLTATLCGMPKYWYHPQTMKSSTRNLFMVPFGSMGKACMSEIALELYWFKVIITPTDLLLPNQ